MQLLICTATALELSAIQASVGKRILPPAHSVRFLVTGVGIGASMYQLTRQLCRHKPQLVIQAGIAGTLDAALVPGDTVVIETDTFGDAGVVEKEQFHNVFQMGLLEPNAFPWTEGKLQNPYAAWLALPGLKKAAAITVNEVTTNEERIRQYRLQWGAQIESMEGASLHYACLMESVPFLQLRSISNTIGERDKSKWRLKEAVHNLDTELNALLDKIMAL